MERSQSCTNFNTTNKNNVHNNNMNNANWQLNNNNKSNSTAESLHLLQGSELQQMQLQHHQYHQQQQLKQQQFQLSGSCSAEHLNSMANSTISGNSLLRLTAMRKKPQLQRQSSASIANNEFHEDTAYHADLEEDAPELTHANEQELDQRCRDLDAFNMLNFQHHHQHQQQQQQHYQHYHHHHHLQQQQTHFPPQYPNHRHQHFAQHKPQSDSMLIHNSSSSSTSPSERRLLHEDSFDSTATMDHSPATQRRQRFTFLGRDNSVHSDSSRYSSVDSLLEARKPDPEAILINLGFGPVGSEDILSRIPKRFLKPSQVRGIDTEAFVKRLQLANTIADNSVLGYRGLTGNPDIPPSSIVAKIMERFEVNQRKKSMGGIE